MSIDQMFSTPVPIAGLADVILFFYHTHYLPKRISEVLGSPLLGHRNASPLFRQLGDVGHDSKPHLFGWLDLRARPAISFWGSGPTKRDARVPQTMGHRMSDQRDSIYDHCGHGYGVWPSYGSHVSPGASPVEL